MSPFFDLMKYKVGNDITYSLFLLILFGIACISIIFVNGAYKVIWNDKIILPIVIAISMFFTLFIHLVLDDDYIFYTFYYGASIYMFLLFWFLNAGEFIYKYSYVILQYVFLILSVSIIYDFVLMYHNMTEMQILYGTKATVNEYGDIRYQYLLRPLGMFGQPSVNSSLVSFSYFFMLAVEKDQHIYSSVLKSVFYFAICVLALILQGSGVGVVSFLGAIFFILAYRLDIKNILLPIIFFLFILYISQQFDLFLQEKISYKGFSEIIHVFIADINATLTKVNSVRDLLIGVSGVKLIDFQEIGFLKFIYQAGLINFILFCLFFAIMFFNSSNDYYKLAIVSLLIGTQHYESMFRAYSMIFILPLLYYSILFPRSDLRRVRC